MIRVCLMCGIGAAWGDEWVGEEMMVGGRGQEAKEPP